MFIESNKKNGGLKTVYILLGSWDFHLVKDDLITLEYFTGEKLYSRMLLITNLKAELKSPLVYSLCKLLSSQTLKDD